MTHYTVLACGSDWHGFPCRGHLTVPEHAAFAPRAYARSQGWTQETDGRDLCPAHTLRAANQAAAR